MKKIAVLLTIVLWVISMGGCGRSSNKTSDEEISENVGQSEADTDQFTQEQENETEGTESSSVEDGPSFESCSIIQPFRNGLAWVSLTGNNDDYVGIIDKTGKLLYFTDVLESNAVSDVFPFNKDRVSIALVYSEDISGYQCYQVSGDGNLFLFQDREGEPERMGYSLLGIERIDGYCGELCYGITEEGFDNKTVTYVIYNDYGKKVTEKTYDLTESKKPSVEYFGNGMFSFYKGDFLTDLYFAKSDKWVTDVSCEDIWNSKNYLAVNGWNVDYSFVIFDSYGNSKYTTVPNGWSRDDFAGMSDTAIMFFEDNYYDDDDYYLYDIQNDEYRILDEKYNDRISSELNTASVGDSICSIWLVGADGDYYVGLYDLKTAEIATDPIKASGAYVLNELLFAENDDEYDVYDAKGSLLKSLPGYISNIRYGDGVYTIDKDSGHSEFYDEDWNLLFTTEEIDFTGAKPFTLTEDSVQEATEEATEHNNNEVADNTEDHFSTDEANDSEREAESTMQSATEQSSPFYGIWCGASKDESGAEDIASTLRENGLPADIYITTDWSNLNTERWYVISAGTYNSQEEAEQVLPQIKKYYENAYVKYSGERIQ